MTLLQNALTAEYVILSSAGAHAGQGWQQIITRKQADIGEHQPLGLGGEFASYTAESSAIVLQRL